ECELLQQLVLLIEGFRLEQHAGIEIRPKPVTVSHPVPRLQREDLATVASDALDLDFPDGVVLRHVLELLRKDRGKRPATGLLVDPYRRARGQVAHDLVAGTDDLARHPVQGFQPRCARRVRFLAWRSCGNKADGRAGSSRFRRARRWRPERPGPGSRPWLRPDRRRAATRRASRGRPSTRRRPRRRRWQRRSWRTSRGAWWG